MSGAVRNRRSAGLVYPGRSLWLWFTVLFANFAEAMAEGRGKAQAESLRSARHEMNAKKTGSAGAPATSIFSAPSSIVPASALKKGDVVLVEAGDFIPCDGEVIEGIASVNESAITGESAPVIRRERRSQRRDGRHTCPVRLVGHTGHGEPRRDVSGPDDCHGRGSQAPKDAE